MSCRLKIIPSRKVPSTRSDRNGRVIARINPVRFCPVCGWKETLEHIRLAQFDFKCNRCGKATLSQYIAAVEVSPIFTL